MRWVVVEFRLWKLVEQHKPQMEVAEKVRVPYDQVVHKLQHIRVNTHGLALPGVDFAALPPVLALPERSALPSLHA